MTRRSPINFLAGAAAVPIVALALAGCGGGGNSGATASASPAAPKATSGSSATIRVANTGLGKVLVDSQGRTVYMFQKDVGTKSACSGACAAAWPPVRATGKPTVGSGLNASLVGTSPRSDGGSQVTYNGHPLYRFVKDQKPGDTIGEGVTAFGGTWFAVSPAGKQISAPAKRASGGSAPPASKPHVTPKPAPKPASPPAPKPSPPSSSSGIPQNGGGDGDADNNGGPSDGDGGI